MMDDIYREMPDSFNRLWEKIYPGHNDKQMSYIQSRIIQRTMIYGELLRNYRIQPRGILYLGANIGQLLWIWLQLGFRKVLMVEPQEEACLHLGQVCEASSKLMITYESFTGSKDPCQLHVAQCACGDQDGETLLYVTSNDHLTSLQAPLPYEIEADVDDREGYMRVVEKKTIPIVKIDTLVASMAPDVTPDDYNMIYMNIQGAELKALRGAEKQLKKVHLILLENNFRPRYEGCPTVEELNKHLAGLDFKPVWGYKNSGIGNGFTAYVRSDLIRG